MSSAQLRQEIDDITMVDDAEAVIEVVADTDSPMEEEPAKEADDSIIKADDSKKKEEEIIAEEIDNSPSKKKDKKKKDENSMDVIPKNLSTVEISKGNAKDPKISPAEKPSKEGITPSLDMIPSDTNPSVLPLPSKILSPEWVDQKKVRSRNKKKNKVFVNPNFNSLNLPNSSNINNQSNTSSNINPHNSNKAKVNPNDSLLNAKEKRVFCGFCHDKETHRSSDCPLFTLQQREFIVTQRKLCKLCLNRHSGVCRAQGFCPFCVRARLPATGHNAALCHLNNRVPK